MKFWKTMVQVIAATMLSVGTCGAVQEVTLLEKDGLQMVVRLPDVFESANPGMICEIRNTRQEALDIRNDGPAEGFRLSLYDAEGKELPVERIWAKKYDPRTNDTGHHSPGKIPPGDKLTSPSFPLAEVFGEQRREGVRLEMEWGSGEASCRLVVGGWWEASTCGRC